MSEVLKLGKRSQPASANEDSEEDDIQIVEVKKPRISENNGTEGGLLKMINVVNFVENSPRLKRFLKAFLSTFGIHYGTDDNAVVESESRENAPNEEEENDLPASQYFARSWKDKVPISTSAHINTYGKVSKDTNRFVTLKQTQNTCPELANSSYALHEKRAFVPKYTPIDIVSAKCTIDYNRVTQGTKLANGKSQAYSSAASGDSLSSNAFKDSRSSTEIDSPPIDDIQILFNEHKNQQNGNGTTVPFKQYLNGSVDETPVRLFNGLNYSTRSSATAKFGQRFSNTRLSHWQTKFGMKAHDSLKSKHYFAFKHSKTVPRKMTSTAEEVIRIEEREQYQELLHRCSSEQWNRYIGSKSRKNAAVQVNMNELDLTNNHFSNSYFNFSKHREQSDLYSLEPSKKPSSISSELKNGLSDKEELLFFETIPKTCHSKSYSHPFSERRKPQISSPQTFRNLKLTLSPSLAAGSQNAVTTNEIGSPEPMVNGNAKEQHETYPSWTNSKYSEIYKKENLQELPEILFENEKTKPEPHEKSKSRSFLRDHVQESKLRPKYSEIYKKEKLQELPEILFENEKTKPEPHEKSKSRSFLRDHVQESKLRPSNRDCVILNSSVEDAKRSFVSDTQKKDSAVSLKVFPQTSHFSLVRDKPVKSFDFPPKIDHFELKNTTTKPRSASSSFTSTAWIQEMKRTMDEARERKKKLVADHEEQVNKYKQSQAHKFIKFKKLLQKEESSLPEVICLDKEPTLPSLSPEVEEIIDQALLPHSPSQVMSSIDNYNILWKDIDTLSGSNWLNDEIINFYMLLIKERSKLQGLPSVYAFTSFFYPKLKSQGYSAVKRWTRKVDIFRYDLLFVPLHLGVHWCLAVIDRRHKKIQYYDSMDANENCLTVLQDYLVAEYADKKGKQFDTTGWTLKKMKDIPPQLNGSDCGMFTLKYAEYIARDAKINFTQQNMLYFRRKMVYEIIAGTLI